MLPTTFKPRTPVYSSKQQMEESVPTTIGLSYDTSLDLSTITFTDPRYIRDFVPSVQKLVLRHGGTTYRYHSHIPEQGSNGQVCKFVSSQQHTLMIKIADVRHEPNYDLACDRQVQSKMALAPSLVIHSKLFHRGQIQIMEAGNGDALTLYNQGDPRIVRPLVQFCLDVGFFFLRKQLACPDFKLENIAYFTSTNPPKPIGFRLIDIDSIFGLDRIPHTMVITTVMSINWPDAAPTLYPAALYWYANYRHECKKLSPEALSRKYKLCVLAHTVYSILYTIDAVIFNNWYWSKQYQEYIKQHFFHNSCLRDQEQTQQQLEEYSRTIYTAILKKVQESICR